uniref:Uncharacterized protein n=1 Tax=Alteromonas phage ZP6 TaxID=2492447 RepID=A0A7D7KHW0_9CAUD
MHVLGGPQKKKRVYARAYETFEGHISCTAELGAGGTYDDKAWCSQIVGEGSRLR